MIKKKNFISISEVREEFDAIPPLKHISYIHYLIWFKKDQAKIQALLDSGNEVNVITLISVTKLSFKV